MQRTLATYLPKQVTLVDPVSLCFAAAILGFTPLRVFAFLLLLFCVARLLPIPFGAIGKLAASFIILIGINSLIAAISWMLDIKLSSGILLLLYAVFVYAASIKIPDTKLALRDIDDIASLVISVFAGLILLMPLLPHPNPVRLASLAIAGGDNSSHIEMIKTNDFNRGYSIGSDNTFNMASNLYTYPQGWHFSGAFLKWVIEPLVPIDTSVSRVLALFYMYSTLWFMLFIFSITRIALYFGNLAKNKKFGVISKFAPLAVVTVATTSLFIPLQASGFQPQIAALTVLLLEIFLLCFAYTVKPQKRYTHFLLCALLVASISFVWIFLLPVATLCLLACFLQTVYSTKSYPPTLFIIGSAILGVTALLQPYTQIKNPEAGGGIDAYGYIPYMYVLAPFAILFLVTSLYVYSKKTSGAQRVLYACTVIVFGFSLCLFLYQDAAFGEPRYYFYKSTHTYLVLLIIFAAYVSQAALKTILQTAAKRPYPMLQFAGVFVTCAILAVTVFFNTKSSEYTAYTTRTLSGISYEQAQIMVDLLAKDKLNGHRYAPIGSCDRGEDIRAVLLAHALTYTPKAYSTPTIVLELTTSDEQLIFKQVNIYLDRYHQPLYVISRDKRLNEKLVQSVSMDNRSLVTIIDADPSPEDTAKAVCPGRLGQPLSTTL